MTRYAVIMAGGSGERFWPWSRSHLPKQFLKLLGENSLLQQSYERIESLFDPQHILVVTGKEHVALTREQLPSLPQENLLIEPQGRNTAPCIGLAAMHIRKRSPDATMLVFPADHLVQGRAEFLRCLEKGLQFASTAEVLVTIGIIPTRPETGYGYIEREKDALPGTPLTFKVRQFVEKPTANIALEYLRAGRYFWNSGIFVWQTDLILNKIEKLLPELHSGLTAIARYIGADGEQEAMARIFPSLPSISIDHGIMEKSPEILVVQGDFGWDDLGSWAALAACFPKDQHKNVVRGEYVGIDTTNCLVYGQDLLIATLGVQDLVIVQAGNAVLVCSKERTQDIKKLVQSLRDQGLDKYL